MAKAQTSLAEQAEVGLSGIEAVDATAKLELDADFLEKCMDDLADNAEQLASVAAQKKSILDAAEKKGYNRRAIVAAFKQRMKPRSQQEQEETNRILECLGDLPLFAIAKLN